jgi:F-type H+-transporting ATPase subunit delta
LRDFTISRRYAKALLFLGREDGNYLRYGQELEAFRNLLQQETQVKEILASPIYESTSRTKLLLMILEKTDFSPTTKSFLQLLQSKGRLGYLDGMNYPMSPGPW